MKNNIEGRIGSLYQTCAKKEGNSNDESGDYRNSVVGKPFGVNYFKIPNELPIDWRSTMETGTSGSFYQKDD